MAQRYDARIGPPWHQKALERLVAAAYLERDAWGDPSSIHTQDAGRAMGNRG